MTTVALYARVSTVDQDCALQLRELNQYCEARGWQVYASYVDTGWSGAKVSRPQMDRLMADARLRKFGVVVCWKLDRWGRSLLHLVQSIQELDSLGVRFIAATQNIDTDQTNPVARLLLHIFAAFAEFERELTRERTVAGLKVARARGKTLGPPLRVFPRDKAAAMRREGMSYRAIADALDVPLTTVVDAIKAQVAE